MRRLIISAAVIAAMTSGAWAGAAMVEGSETCGPLPNPKWSWQITSTKVTTGGETSESTSTDYRWSGTGNDNIPQNGWSSTTTTTTTAPTYEQTNSICTAINPAGKPNADHSTVVAGELVMVDPGGTSSVTGEEVNICDNNFNDNPGGNALPGCPALP